VAIRVGEVVEAALAHSAVDKVDGPISVAICSTGNAAGASSIKNSARLVYTLSAMTREEAQALNHSEEKRKAPVRRDSAKVNMHRRQAKLSGSRARPRFRPVGSA
jgi:hypothetical protein